MLKRTSLKHLILTATLMGTLAGCSSGLQGTYFWGSGGNPPQKEVVSNSALSASTQQSLASQEIQAINDSLNQTENYVLSSEDLAVLQSNGVLEPEDQAALAALIKK